MEFAPILVSFALALVSAAAGPHRAMHPPEYRLVDRRLQRLRQETESQPNDESHASTGNRESKRGPASTESICGSPRECRGPDSVPPRFVADPQPQPDADRNHSHADDAENHHGCTPKVRRSGAWMQLGRPSSCDSRVVDDSSRGPDLRAEVASQQMPTMPRAVAAMTTAMTNTAAPPRPLMVRPDAGLPVTCEDGPETSPARSIAPATATLRVSGPIHTWKVLASPDAITFLNNYLAGVRGQVQPLQESSSLDQGVPHPGSQTVSICDGQCRGSPWTVG